MFFRFYLSHIPSWFLFHLAHIMVSYFLFSVQTKYLFVFVNLPHEVLGKQRGLVGEGKRYFHTSYCNKIRDSPLGSYLFPVSLVVEPTTGSVLMGL